MVVPYHFRCLFSGWSRHIYGLTNLTSDLFMPIGDTTSNACVKLELNALECMEHYGVKRGKALCMDYYDDFHECVNRHKQVCLKSLTGILIPFNLLPFSVVKNVRHGTKEETALSRILSRQA